MSTWWIHPDLKGQVFYLIVYNPMKRDDWYERMKQVLFIHGGGQGAYEEDEKLVANLRDVLGTGYDVQYPKMPHEDRPDYEAWSTQITTEFAALDDEVILVGHSVGGSILLQYLSEEMVEQPVAGLFLLAPPYWDAVENNIAAKFSHEIPLFVYHGRDDEVIPFEHLALYAEQLPQATIHEFDGRGHQFNNDLSAVAQDIKKL